MTSRPHACVPCHYDPGRVCRCVVKSGGGHWGGNVKMPQTANRCWGPGDVSQPKIAVIRGENRMKGALLGKKVGWGHFLCCPPGLKSGGGVPPPLSPTD